MIAHKRVMVVDDEETVRLGWSRYLSEQNFDVTTAEDGGKAINRLRREPVDVVVADLRMPEVDGLELLSWLHGEQPDTPFILLTGYGNADVERRARELGAFDYLDKPIDPDVLAAVITAATVEKERKEKAKRAEAPVVVEAAVEAPVETAVSEAEAPAREHGRVKETAQIVGGLIAGPIIGLAFVMFLPLIGFAAFFKVLGEAITGKRTA
jgi:DNA-binding NtrC family response regulator